MGKNELEIVIALVTIVETLTICFRSVRIVFPQLHELLFLSSPMYHFMSINSDFMLLWVYPFFIVEWKNIQGIIWTTNNGWNSWNFFFCVEEDNSMISRVSTVCSDVSMPLWVQSNCWQQRKALKQNLGLDTLI